MLFNSTAFAVFLPIVFALYWVIGSKNIRIQNILLLAASYYFYSCWNYKFLALLIFSITIDFFAAKKIASETSHSRRLWFWFSISLNVLLLFFFKYYNFFAESFAQALIGLGLHASVKTISLILPVGISFYTFHELSYIIDVYKRRIQPVENYVDYSLFVTFFPLLVAGPIERATHLLPQIQTKRIFDYNKMVDGLRQILWGLFKKIVVADTCALYVNNIFDHYPQFSGSVHLLGAVFFAFQIYCDFSGYSDIALGTARLFGIELLRNFSFPYFSRDIAEFWRRWHISLSAWFRDYVYIPLGGSRGSFWTKLRNVLIIFLLSGFWHGANWTFIAWGLLNALYFIPLLIFSRNRHHLETVAQGRLFPTLKEFISMVGTFLLVVFAWIFFRAPTLTDAFKFIKPIFSRSLLTSPHQFTMSVKLLAVFFLLVEWLGREDRYAIQTMFTKGLRIVRWTFYLGLTIMILMFGADAPKQEFIYFQF